MKKSIKEISLAALFCMIIVGFFYGVKLYKDNSAPDYSGFYRLATEIQNGKKRIIVDYPIYVPKGAYIKAHDGQVIIFKDPKVLHRLNEEGKDEDPLN